MKQYIYPQNLKSQAQLWLWRLKDLVVLGAALLVSVLALSQLRFFLPLALTMVFAFLTMRFDDTSVSTISNGSPVFCEHPAILCVEAAITQINWYRFRTDAVDWPGT